MIGKAEMNMWGLDIRWDLHQRQMNEAIITILVFYISCLDFLGSGIFFENSPLDDKNMFITSVTSKSVGRTKRA